MLNNKITMKRVRLIFLVFFIPFNLFSQINWVKEMSVAQALSVSTGKLIVIDFYATWCGPCKIMDSDLWSSAEMKEISDRFIFLRIDVDYETIIASEYHISTIPHVIITNITGDILWQKNGYNRNNKSYLEIFKNAPGDISQLNDKLLPFFLSETTAQDQFELGKAYQILGKNQSDAGLRTSFLSLSNKCFNKIKKEQTNQSKEAELRTILNLVYNDKPEKALSKLEKLAKDYFGEEMRELADFTEALCYKQTDRNENFKDALSRIANPDFLVELKE